MTRLANPLQHVLMLACATVMVLSLMLAGSVRLPDGEAPQLVSPPPSHAVAFTAEVPR